MAFTSIESILVPAPGHGHDVFYRVAYGTENWQRGTVSVFKIQIAFENGDHPNARFPPSFPSIEEWKAVKEAMDQLVAAYPD